MRSDSVSEAMNILCYRKSPLYVSTCFIETQFSFGDNLIRQLYKYDHGAQLIGAGGGAPSCMV